MGTLSRGHNSDIFIFASFLKDVNSQRKEFAPPRRKFFPLRVDLYLDRVCYSGKIIGSDKSCLPLKMGVYPFTLHVNLFHL